MAIDSANKRLAFLTWDTGGPPFTTGATITEQERAVHLGIYSVTGDDDSGGGGGDDGDDSMVSGADVLTGMVHPVAISGSLVD